MKTRPGCSNDNWQFAEPDYAKAETLPRVETQAIKEGDYIMVQTTAGRWNLGVVRVAARREGTLSLVSYDVVHVEGGNWAHVKSTCTVQATTIKTQSARYRMFKPQPKPLPPPVVVEPKITEKAAYAPVDKSATLTALASIDAGIQTLCDLVREQNKILCSLVAGASATQDTARETLEHIKEVWK